MYGFGRRCVCQAMAHVSDSYSPVLFTLMPIHGRWSYAHTCLFRMCPGATMADHAIFAFTACILWALDIRPPLKNGVEELPSVDPTRFSSGGEAS